MDLNTIQNIYFLGIGGIGMSGLARYFQLKGKNVAGYDRTETELTKQLAAEGMAIHYEDDPAKLPTQIDLVIYTPAIPKDHQEFNYLKTKEIPILKRAQVLGLISKNQRCIAVAGTHGKTTTSTIITHLLRAGGVDCSAFLGGISLNLNSNFVAGATDWVVVEADEFDRSFLQLYPEIAVITSMDADHLDIYGTADEVQRTYRQFATQVSHTLIHKQDLPLDGLTLAATRTSYNVDTADVCVQNLRIENGYSVFDYIGKDGTILRDLQFTQIGRHNVENATAAITVALQLGVTEAGLREGLHTFKGIQRRFEFIIRRDNQLFIDDYAHHPEELRAAIRAAKMVAPDQRITGVFQPHLFTRTRDFADGFAAALDELDEVILLDIYPARELPIEGVTSDIIFRQMQNPNKQLITKAELLPLLQEHRPRALLTVGAGDIGAMVQDIAKLLQ